MTASLLSSPPPGVPLRRFLREGWGTVTGPGFAAAHPDVIDEMAASIARRPTPRFAVLDQARAIAAWSGAGRLRRLAVPTTVVHGSEDPLIPVRNGMRIAQLVPGAPLRRAAQRRPPRPVRGARRGGRRPRRLNGRLGLAIGLGSSVAL